jgi:flavodoxin
MNTLIISYSLTGNNQALAKRLAAELHAQHIVITEPKPRTILAIFLDVLFNRTPKIDPIPTSVNPNDMVIFIGPVWMGQIATPLRACFKQFKHKVLKYAFISISGGADGDNTKLGDELIKRTGVQPVAMIDLHIADLLPSNPRPQRKETSAYRLNGKDLDKLIETIKLKLSQLDLNK